MSASSPSISHALSQPAVEETRLLVLDVFRATAITAVMLHHYLTRYAPPDHVPSLYSYRFTYPRWLDLGAMGVQFFFIISGFVIFMTLQRSRHLLEFWFRRVARLYPPYLIAMLVTFLVVNAAGPPEFHSTLTDIGAGLAFANGYVPGARFVDGSYWSLVEEMKFYLVIGLFYMLFRQRFVMAWTSYVVAGAFLWLLGASSEWHWLRMIARHFCLTETMPYFTVGILYFKVYVGERRGCWLLGLAALAAYLATEPEFVNPPELVHMRPWVTLAMLVLFTLFVNGKLEWLAVRPLVFVGSISYSFYLLHQYIGVSLIPYLTRGLHLPDLLACTATALVSGLLAFVLTRIVEIPTKAALLRWARAHLFPRLAVVLPGFAFARPPRLGMISRRPVSAVRQPETT